MYIKYKKKKRIIKKKRLFYKNYLDSCDFQDFEKFEPTILNFGHKPPITHLTPILSTTYNLGLDFILTIFFGYFETRFSYKKRILMKKKDGMDIRDNW